MVSLPHFFNAPSCTSVPCFPRRRCFICIGTRALMFTAIFMDTRRYQPIDFKQNKNGHISQMWTKTQYRVVWINFCWPIAASGANRIFISESHVENQTSSVCWKVYILLALFEISFCFLMETFCSIDAHIMYLRIFYLSESTISIFKECFRTKVTFNCCFHT